MEAVCELNHKQHKVATAAQEAGPLSDSASLPQDDKTTRAKVLRCYEYATTPKSLETVSTRRKRKANKTVFAVAWKEGSVEMDDSGL